MYKIHKGRNEKVTNMKKLLLVFYARNFNILFTSLLLWLIPLPANCAELDVSELISSMKGSIIEAQKVSGPPYMNLPWIEGEISYVVKKEGKGGFKLYVVTAEGKYATEAVHRVKFRLEPINGKWRVEKEGEFKDSFASSIHECNIYMDSQLANYVNPYFPRQFDGLASHPRDEWANLILQGDILRAANLRFPSSLFNASSSLLGYGVVETKLAPAAWAQPAMTNAPIWNMRPAWNIVPWNNSTWKCVK